MTTRLSLPGNVTRNSLSLPAGMTFEQWEAVGEQLAYAEGAVLFWVGDWWHYGDHHYGERAAQARAAGEGGFAYQTLRNAGWVCGQVEPSRRRDNLSFAHHAEVAGLEPDAQDAILARAVNERMTRGDVRAAVREAKRVAEVGSAEASRLAVAEFRHRVLGLAAKVEGAPAVLRDIADELERK